MSRVWLITGASSGFGRLLAERAVSVGDHVIAVARRSAPLCELASTAPRNVTPVILDVTDDRAEKLIGAAVDQVGTVDVLVNNAGYGLAGAVEQTRDSAARKIFETNFFAGISVLRAVLPALRASQGRVVQISSYLGHVVWPGAGLYSATKSAVNMLSDTLAAELEPLGVKVTTIQPGLFDTGFTQSMEMFEPNKLYEKTINSRLSEVPAGGDPALVVDAVMTIATHPEPPRRLAVGRDAVDGIRAVLTRQLAEIAEWEAVSVGSQPQ